MICNNCWGSYCYLLFIVVQEALNNLEDYDKTCLEAALQGVSNVVQQEWGTACPCQVKINKKSNY